MRTYSNWMHRESFDSSQSGLLGTAPRSGSPGYWLLVRGHLRATERGEDNRNWVTGKSKKDIVMGSNLFAGKVF